MISAACIIVEWAKMEGKVLEMRHVARSLENVVRAMASLLVEEVFAEARNARAAVYLDFLVSRRYNKGRRGSDKEKMSRR